MAGIALTDTSRRFICCHLRYSLVIFPQRKVIVLWLAGLWTLHRTSPSPYSIIFRFAMTGYPPHHDHFRHLVPYMFEAAFYDRKSTPFQCTQRTYSSSSLLVWQCFQNCAFDVGSRTVYLHYGRVAKHVPHIDGSLSSSLYVMSIYGGRDASYSWSPNFVVHR
jgi:hypothetical protein